MPSVLKQCVLICELLLIYDAFINLCFCYQETRDKLTLDRERNIIDEYIK